MFNEETEREYQEYGSEYKRAEKRALYLLGNRDYSSNALKEKLLNNYSHDIAEKVIEDMKSCGFLNDEEYARKLAAALIREKKYGVHRAKSEMKRRGVSPLDTEEALSAYEREDYTEELICLVEKKYINKIQDRDDRRRTVAALIRRGYGFSEIKDAIMTVLHSQEDESSEE